MTTIRNISIFLLMLSFLAGGCSSWGGKINNTEGVSYYSKGQYDQALSAFQTAARLNPEDPEVYYNIASTYQQQALRYQDSSLLTQAETNYRICLQKEPSHETTVCCYRGLATVLNQKKEGDLALKTLKEWEDKEPTSIEPKLEIAYLLEAQGKNEEAADALNKIKEWAPNDYRPFYKLGIIKEKMGDDAGALEELRTAARLNPTNQELVNKITILEGKKAPSAADSIPSDLPENADVPKTETADASKTGAVWSTPVIDSNQTQDSQKSGVTFKTAPQAEAQQAPSSDGFTSVTEQKEPVFNSPAADDPVPQSAPIESDLPNDLPSYDKPTEGAIPAGTPVSSPAKAPAAEGSADQTIDSLFQDDPLGPGTTSPSTTAFQPLTLSQNSAQNTSQTQTLLQLPDGTGSQTFKLAYSGDVPAAALTVKSNSAAVKQSSTRKSRVGEANPGPPRVSVGGPF